MGQIGWFNPPSKTPSVYPFLNRQGHPGGFMTMLMPSVIPRFTFRTSLGCWHPLWRSWWHQWLFESHHPGRSKKLCLFVSRLAFKGQGAQQKLYEHENVLISLWWFHLIGSCQMSQYVTMHLPYMFIRKQLPPNMVNTPAGKTLSLVMRLFSRSSLGWGTPFQMLQNSWSPQDSSSYESTRWHDESTNQHGLGGFETNYLFGLFSISTTWVHKFRHLMSIRNFVIHNHPSPIDAEATNPLQRPLPVQGEGGDFGSAGKLAAWAGPNTPHKVEITLQ